MLRANGKEGNMAEFQLDYGDKSGGDWFNSRDDFVQGFVEAMFFTLTGSSDDGDLEQATVAQLAPETRERIGEMCNRFQRINRDLLDQAIEVGHDCTMSGRDFWYTSQGHGAGFWDGDLPKDLGELLTRAAKNAGHTGDLYRGDDGLLYL